MGCFRLKIFCVGAGRCACPCLRISNDVTNFRGVVKTSVLCCAVYPSPASTKTPMGALLSQLTVAYGRWWFRPLPDTPLRSKRCFRLNISNALTGRCSTQNFCVGAGRCACPCLRISNDVTNFRGVVKTSVLCCAKNEIRTDS